MQMERFKCRDTDASREGVGDDSNAACLNGSRETGGVAQAAIHSQVASQGTGAVNVLG
jgi:hypothetical protein